MACNRRNFSETDGKDLCLCRERTGGRPASWPPSVSAPCAVSTENRWVVKSAYPQGLKYHPSPMYHLGLEPELELEPEAEEAVVVSDLVLRIRQAYAHLVSGEHCPGLRIRVRRPHRSHASNLDPGGFHFSGGRRSSSCHRWGNSGGYRSLAAPHPLPKE